MAGKHHRHHDRLIDCRDLAGHRRQLIVFADRGRIVLIVPPAETAVLAPSQVGALRAALRDAAVEAVERRNR